MSQQNCLVLGAGELGTAVTRSLLQHPQYKPGTTSVAMSMRQETIDQYEEAAKQGGILQGRFEEISQLTQMGARLIAADLVQLSKEELSTIVAGYSCVIHAGAMSLPAGTQTKVTEAVIAAGVKEYVPWQWGVDYDMIGGDGAFGLFREAYNVRNLLRSQKQTNWWIVSCGVFMSFIFEEFWGVIMRDEKGKIEGVRALGGWDHMITATHVPDMSKVNANLALADMNVRDLAVHIAGTTVSYAEFADIVERVVGKPLKREVWTSEFLKEQCEKSPEDKLAKYRLVFSEDKGLSWPKRGSYYAEMLEWDFEKYMKHYQIR